MENEQRLDNCGSHEAYELGAAETKEEILSIVQGFINNADYSRERKAARAILYAIKEV